MEAAQAQRYTRGLLELTGVFDQLVRACNNVEEFNQVIIRVLAAVFAPEREAIRAERADVLGSAMSRPHLKQEVALSQSSSHR